MHSFKSRPHFGKTSSSRKQKVAKLSSFDNMAERPYTLNAILGPVVQNNDVVSKSFVKISNVLKYLNFC